MAGVERYFTDSVLDAISRYAPPEGGQNSWSIFVVSS